MSLRSRYHVNAFVVLTRTDHYCLQHYIKTLLNIVLWAICPKAIGH